MTPQKPRSTKWFLCLACITKLDTMLLQSLDLQAHCLVSIVWQDSIPSFTQQRHFQVCSLLCSYDNTQRLVSLDSLIFRYMYSCFPSLSPFCNSHLSTIILNRTRTVPKSCLDIIHTHKHNMETITKPLMTVETIRIKFSHQIRRATVRGTSVEIIPMRDCRDIITTMDLDFQFQVCK